MICTGYPKKLWDHCLKLEALIRPNTALYICMIDGEVPETVMRGQASYISRIFELSWYQWLMFFSGPVQYPAGNFLLRRILGPARDVRPAMTSKILRVNGEVVPRSILRALTLEEIESPAHLRKAPIRESICLA